MEVTRRSFLKNATLGAIGAGLAGTGLVGCSSESTGAQTDSPTGQTAGAASDAIRVRQHAAQLNPQDALPEVGNTPCPSIFTEWNMGSLTVPNRITKSAAGYIGITARGITSPLMDDYYGTLAKNGVGLIYTDDFAELYDHFRAIADVGKIVDWKEEELQHLANVVHDNGGLIGYQLATMGLVFSGFEPDPTAIFQTSTCMDMTTQEITDLIADTVNAAVTLKRCGFDCVEINSAGENVGQTFMSRARNSRDDEFGPQSIENRCRFVTEIVKGIKQACGDDFPVQVLINGIEENDKSIGDSALFTTVEENKQIAKLLEEAGADSLHVRVGPCGMHVAEFAGDLFFTGYGIEGTTSYGTQFDFTRHWEGKMRARTSGLGMMVDIASEIKSAVSIPVGTVTYMDPARDPEYFESIIADGLIDFMHINRPLNVDPEYVMKLWDGRLDEIRPCTRCLHCHWDSDREGNLSFGCRTFAPHPYRIITGVMPKGYDAEPATALKNVMVVGGGPAGMEAARVAAERGHSVTLYEKSATLGGLLDFAHLVKGPHENLDVLKNYLAHQLDIAGVQVVTGQEVDSAFIEQQSPDVAVIAVGGVRPTLGLSETEGTRIVPIDDFGTVSGDDVVIAGGNLQAVDLAMYFLAQGKRVQLVTGSPDTTFGNGHSFWVRSYTQPMMKALGVRFWPEASITAVGDGVITIRTASGIETELACSTLVEALDMEPDTSLADGLTVESISVGDCNDPYNISNAILSGNVAARSI